jgi:ankyrin repeat protein
MAQISHKIKSELWDVCQQGNTSRAIEILGLINLDDYDVRYWFESDFRKMIYIASRNNHIDIVCILYHIDILWGSKNTLIKYAAQHDSPEVIKFLIEKGAKVGHGALHNAVYNRQENIVQILLDTKVNTNILNRDYYDKKKTYNSLVHTAIEADQINILQMLLLAKSDINRKTHTYGHTPLYKATKLGNLNIVQLLILSKAGVHERANNGGTPLTMAIHNITRKFNIVRSLIQAKANTNNEYEEKLILEFSKELNI